MRYRPKMGSVVIALGVIAALSIASPVFGGGGGPGKATKRQIRKEVARQIGKARGPAGLNGQNGQIGLNGATSVVMRGVATPALVTPGTVNNSIAKCSGSERALGGGAIWDEITTTNLPIIQSVPSGENGTVSGDTPTGWSVTGGNATGTDKHLRAWVVCASP